MSYLKKAESTLARIYKGAPELKKEYRDLLVKWMPWLVVVGGVLLLLSALSLYKAYTYVSPAQSAFGQFIGVADALRPKWTLWVILALVFQVVQGLLLLSAFPKLQKKQKAGWDIVLLSGLVGLGYSVLSLLVDGYGLAGPTGFILGLLISLVAFWLLFSVRDSYHGTDLKVDQLNPFVDKKTKK